MSGNLAVSTINGVDISVSPVLNETQLKGALNATGTAPIYVCRAWVNFNGTGTVAIRASGNVSSITDNGVGDYTMNFTTAMPDVNYSFSGAGQNSATSCLVCGAGASFAKTTSSLQRVVSLNSSMTVIDAPYVDIQIFR